MAALRGYRVAEPPTGPPQNPSSTQDAATTRGYRLAGLLTRPPPPFVQDLVLFATAWSHVFLAPYTKVEEGFNLHAIHDVLMYGVGPNAVQNVSDDFSL